MSKETILEELRKCQVGSIELGDYSAFTDKGLAAFAEAIAVQHEAEVARVKKQAIDRLLDLAAGEELYQNRCGGREDWERVRDILRAAARDLQSYFGERQPQTEGVAELRAGESVAQDVATEAQMQLLQAREQLAQPQAQVALMRRVLEMVLELTDHDTGEAYKSDWLRIELAIDQALAAAPRVAARLKMRLRREPMGDRYLEATGQDSYLAMGTLRYDETYDVLVMAGEQGQESGHGYKRAKGIIPWKEGDELPEDTIARLRGRPSWRCECGAPSCDDMTVCWHCGEEREYGLTASEARAVARKLNRLEAENKGLSAMLAAATLAVARPHQKQPCGHERRFIIGEANDPNWCALCLLKKMQENPNSVWVIDREEAADESD